jgi:hypothetical protein
VAKKRPKSSKSKTRKKAAASGAKKKRGRSASPTHYDYELDQNFQDALDTMSAHVKTILKKLDENDLNTAPTAGILKRIKALIAETTNGKPTPAAHENRIERILYAIGGMNDQYYIDKKRPGTVAKPPSTTDPHEKKVVTLVTTTNAICREVFSLLDPVTKLKAPPKPGGIDITQDIVDMTLDTQMVVDNILNNIVSHHLLILTSK